MSASLSAFSPFGLAEMWGWADTKPRNKRRGSNMASKSSVLTSSALLERAYLPRRSEESSRTKSHGTDWLFVQPWSWEGGSATQKLPERRVQA